MPNDVAHKSWWQIFEVVFGIPFLLAIALQWFVPISLSRGFITPVRILAGAILVVAGISLVVLARREFARYGQPTDPGHPTSKIISTGVFSFSRNPLYLGGVLFLAGLSFLFDLPWALILLLPSVVACQSILIAPEEAYLAAGSVSNTGRTRRKSAAGWAANKVVARMTISLDGFVKHSSGSVGPLYPLLCYNFYISWGYVTRKSQVFAAKFHYHTSSQHK